MATGAGERLGSIPTVTVPPCVSTASTKFVICHALQIPFITPVLVRFPPLELRLNIDTGDVQFRFSITKELSKVEGNPFTLSLNIWPEEAC
jgi:hypothetical protein